MTKKKIPRRRSKYYKECERCGNGGFTKETVFRCRYCGYINGMNGKVKIVRGGIDD